jgi:hypothetical protein
VTVDNNSNAINAIIGKNPADFKDAVTNELGRKLHLALDRAREAVAASSLNRSAPVEEEAIAEGTTQNDAKKIVALIRAEFDESNPSESPYMMAYSGRGMMGKYCLGVSIPMRWDHERWLKMLREKRIQTPSGDALGMGSVLYWPNIPWDKEMFKNPHPKKYEFDEGLIHTPTESVEIQEKVEIDGRTRAYKSTVSRLEQARKSRTPLTQGSPADKYAGLYDDGSGKGASVPSPLDINPSRFQHITGVTEQVVDESSDKYKKFFKSALKKFGANTPADLKGDKKKRFFDYVEKNWKGEEE